MRPYCHNRHGNIQPVKSEPEKKKFEKRNFQPAASFKINISIYLTLYAVEGAVVSIVEKRRILLLQAAFLLFGHKVAPPAVAQFTDFTWTSMHGSGGCSQTFFIFWF
ncbi:hypothetical protein EYF80_060062 [Liparis tanakae]|uniref:Uncharacterized protein n=1 Tax=Liparis tanakae TaxID=230148 RepID=A0A4Z2ELX6_9TELE|nr:hypothetical protein EYF80_060062 [Liparis tanakae]